jgi:hypothetical protein
VTGPRAKACACWRGFLALRDVAAQQSKSLLRVSETGSIDRVGFAIAAVDLPRIGADRGPDLAGHDDRAFDVRSRRDRKSRKGIEHERIASSDALSS